MPRLPGFLPEDLRQLARFVPSSGWDAIRWRPLLASLRSVSWRLASGSGVDELVEAVAPLVEPIKLGEFPEDHSVSLRVRISAWSTTSSYIDMLKRRAEL